MRREVWEEASLWAPSFSGRAPRVGPWVWSRSHRWRWAGQTYRARERFYLLRVERLDVSTANWEPEERAVTREIRWWSVVEIAEVFVPRRMADLVAPIVAGELPESPVETGA